jgi:DNA-binding LacI/PurR family transcriptional regulator
MGGATGGPADDAGARRGQPTLENVAAAAGVSRSTASRAINGEAKVSPRARAAVEAAVLRLGFMPNQAARTLVTQRTNAVALVVPEPDERILADPFFGAAIQGLSRALADTDLQLVLVMASMGGTPERTVRYLRHGHVDGAVVVSHHQADDIEGALVDSRLPSVFVGRPWNLPDRLSYVDTDNRGGGELATERLIARRCRRIGTVAGPADMTSAQDRLAGWRTALGRAGLPADAIEHGDFTTDGGAAATRRLLAAHPDLDAVFVASDLMAAGALAVLRAGHRTVPDDVAVVGYDDSAVAAVTDPPLTTVVNPVGAMARTAGGLLLRWLDGTEPDDPVIFPAELVVRSSG